MTVDISDEQLNALSELSAERNATRELLVVEALDAYLKREGSDLMPSITPSSISDPDERKRALLASFGSLQGIGDGMAFQDRIRNEWVREWDQEYDPNVHG